MKIPIPAILVMTPQILKSVDFPKTQKPRYVEKETLFFFKLENFINYTSRAALWQNSFVAEVTFKNCIIDFTI